jgi:hypothetical protein
LEEDMKNPALIAAQSILDFARRYETLCIFHAARTGDEALSMTATNYARRCREEQDRQTK